MPVIETRSGVCSDCGATTDAALLGDEAVCIACLLRIGFDETESSDDSLELAVPDHIGSYVIARHEDGGAWELGRGAMGITFRAIDEQLQRPVALKTINAARRGAEARERFMREARSAASLKHPNVATVYQFGFHQESGQFFYAMELVEGETLEERVRRSGPLNVLTTIEIGLQVTAALAAAEERGLVHRDLKPGNLMLVSNKDGAATVKVIDFGVAKAIVDRNDPMAITQGGFVGTPAFASPEQFTNFRVDVRSDIYSLGVTLWFLLTGHPLFSGRTIEEIQKARESQPLPIEQLKITRAPRRLISLLMSMLAVEPAARPAGARDLEARLLAIRNEFTRSKTRYPLTLAAGIVALATALIVWNSYRRSTAALPPEKSIAVLPFQSLVDAKDSSYLADGVQEDVLTDLAKVADLKVIGRRSVAQYSDTKQPPREIGRALQVSHVLEGTVAKVGGRIHVTAQLIDTRTEAETWAEKYDRDVADLFQIQSEISQAIVAQLKSSLSAAARASIEEKPTQDDEAYDLYLRARALIRGQNGSSTASVDENVNGAIKLLESATQRDPRFTLAYCLIAEAEIQRDYVAWGSEKAALIKAKEALDAALRLSPASPEGHLSLAQYYMEGTEDYLSAKKALTIAALGLPGRVEVFKLRRDLGKRTGEWNLALEAAQKSSELDPRDVDSLVQLVWTLVEVRRFSDAERILYHIRALEPQQMSGPSWRLRSYIALARGDVKAAMAALDASPSRNGGFWLFNLMLGNLLAAQGQYHEAEQLMLSAEELARKNNRIPKSGEQAQTIFLRALTFERLGRLARGRGELDKADSYFKSARQNFQAWWTNRPEHNAWVNSLSLAYTAEVDAALGRRQDALREGQQALELFPVAKDARVAPHLSACMAVTYMWAGDHDAALRELANISKQPLWASDWPGCPVIMTAGALKLDPVWNELRRDPRFDKIVAEAAKPIKLD